VRFHSGCSVEFMMYVRRATGPIPVTNVLFTKTDGPSKMIFKSSSVTAGLSGSAAMRIPPFRSSEGFITFPQYGARSWGHSSGFSV
jgi:hypothetical protein